MPLVMVQDCKDIPDGHLLAGVGALIKSRAEIVEVSV